MNCPKCGAQLKEGDKFCQVCGSVIEETTQPAAAPVQEPTVQAEAAAPVAPVTPEPTPAPQAPTPTITSGPALTSDNTQGVPQKKNNTVVMILVAVVLFLVGFAIAYFVFGSNGSSGNNGGSNGGNSTPATPVVQKKTTTTTIGEFKVELPEGYGVSIENNKPYFYKNDNSVYGTFEKTTGNILNADETTMAAYFQQKGLVGSTGTKTTVNGKKAIIIHGTYNNYEEDIIYVQADPVNIICGEIMYYTAGDYSKEKDNAQGIYGTASIVETTANAKTGGLMPKEALK